MAVVLVAFGLILLPVGQSFGLASLPWEYFAFLVIVVPVYLLVIDYLKVRFIKKFKVWN